MSQPRLRSTTQRRFRTWNPQLPLAQFIGDSAWSIQDLDDELLRPLTRDITTPAASPPEKR
jgi:hypothetical protein